MKLAITSFAEPGNIQKERIVLKAHEDIELGHYAIFRSKTSDDGKATSGRKIAYWFPDGKIKKNDLVVLYSKKGISSQKELEGGRTAHFFYWGEPNAIWNDTKYTAVVLRSAEWTAKSPTIEEPSEE
ncbi:hypothetical protein [Aquipseudomonas alcaligenes]|uniref:hypothetical protein n=1 Tax=Aquipseudomonas alcaligenes TaxID=43263 RepID=UPI0012E9497E|nr:hypothetical protein [Pseudomonas alcaligenes]